MLQFPICLHEISTHLPATAIYEKAIDQNFLDEVYGIRGGEKIKECIQCGTCSGACPVSWAMEETRYWRWDEKVGVRS